MRITFCELTNKPFNIFENGFQHMNQKGFVNPLKLNIFLFFSHRSCRESRHLKFGVGKEIASSIGTKRMLLHFLILYEFPKICVRLKDKGLFNLLTNSFNRFKTIQIFGTKKTVIFTQKCHLISKGKLLWHTLGKIM